MMKNVWGIMLVLALVCCWAGAAMAFETFRGPTEVVYYDPDKAQEGYTIFSSGLKDANGDPTLAVIDMDGSVVNQVSFPGWSSVSYGYLLGNGNFLADGSSADSVATPNSLVRAGGAAGNIREVTWDGQVVTDLVVFGEWWTMHHDMRKIYNKALGEYTFIFLTWEAFSADEAIALGADPDDDPDSWVDGWTPCGVYEVTADGQIVWRWSFADHIIQNYDQGQVNDFVNAATGYTIAGATYGMPEDNPGKIDINSDNMHPGWTSVQKDWNHCNSLDYNEDLGHIVVNAKHQSEIFAFDHDGTFVSTTDVDANLAASRSDAGDFLYRFGNPSAYNQGDPSGYEDPGDYQFWAAHNIHWVGKAYYDGWTDLPGEGNMIIFDNGTWNPVDSRSRVIEWNPFLDATRTNTGNYVNPPDAGYGSSPANDSNYNISNQVEWKFQSSTPGNFYSFYISSIQRMPNGNTLVDAGSQGHFFEVTPEGEVVWEYIKPVYSGGVLLEFSDDVHGNGGRMGNTTFRCWRAPADHPGLVGKDLSPQGTFTQLGGLTRPQVDIPTFSVDYTASSDGSGVNISGTVMNGSVPVNAMVLCSGQYTFASAADGTFSMSGLPTEGDGTVVLQVYAYGHAPFQVTVTP